jgi:hypothetical protein
MKSSRHSLIPFLPLFCSWQFQRLYSVQFQAHISAGWRPENRLFTSIYAAEHFFITTLHRPCGKRLLLSRIVLDVFTYPLPSNRHPIVALVYSRGNVFTESLPSNGSIHHNNQYPSRDMNSSPHVSLIVIASANFLRWRRTTDISVSWFWQFESRS